MGKLAITKLALHFLFALVGLNLVAHEGGVSGEPFRALWALV